MDGAKQLSDRNGIHIVLSELTLNKASYYTLLRLDIFPHALENFSCLGYYTVPLENMNLNTHTATRLQLASNTINEERPAVLLGVLEPRPLDLDLDPVDDRLQLLLCKEAGDFPRGQEVVDEYQELLVGNLGVCQHEDGTDVLQSGLHVQLGQVDLEHRDRK